MQATAHRRHHSAMLSPSSTNRLSTATTARSSMMKAPMRPLSTATEMFDVDSDVEIEEDESSGDGAALEQSQQNMERTLDWERQRQAIEDDDEDDSEFEEDFYAGKQSFESNDTRRRSLTTLSSYDEAPTPDRHLATRGFDMMCKPVEGPRGPHLFRSSQNSAEIAFEHALQMSPLIPIKLDLGLEPPRRNSRETGGPSKQLDLSDDINDEDAHSIIRRWSPTEVIDWMISWDIDPSVVRCFEKHDINGAVLLDLQWDHLRELEIESFGKRHQLWSAICILRGDDEPSIPQESSRPSTRNAPTRSSSHGRDEPASSESDEVDATVEPPVTERKKRRGRKDSRNHDTILPQESVSIVAIEQLLPKPHRCSKGEACLKWQKQQAQIQALQQGNNIGCFPISPSQGARVMVPPNPAAPAARLRVPIRQTMPALPSPRTAIQQSEPGTPFRPVSENVPSLVASSDLLGPGQLPAFTLDPDMLEKLEKRDPQDNVRNFLNFQHMNSPTAIPQTPLPDDDYPTPRSNSVPPVPQLFPTQHHQAYPSLATETRSKTTSPVGPAGPGDRLKGLPKLDIPRSGSASSDNTYYPNGLVSPRGVTASPTQIYRLGTPASEMNVPVTAVPLGPVARDASQSVPPNMQYRQPTQTPRVAVHRPGPADWRRPSQLPAVKENEVFPTYKQHQIRPSVSTNHSMDSVSSTWSSPEKKVTDPAHNSPVTRQFGYGTDCTHAGWMKKRRTKMLRHEWQEAHFRLMGTQLNMHDSARLTAALKDSINVDEYAVACSTVPANSKLTAAMRAFHLGNQDKVNAKEIDPTAFAFQLVPEREKGPKRFATPSLGKTHHFAVKSKDERIDWMREIMLTKALQQRGKGYDVEVNGVQA